MRNLKVIIVVIFCLIMPSALCAQQNGNNAPVIKKYISPDVYYFPEKKIRLKKLDLNKASLEQLMALPEINEDLALKIMRRRPIKTLQDIINLPYIDIDRMKIIVKGLAYLVIQPVDEEKTLKQ